jgi:quinolinate synthase
MFRTDPQHLAWILENLVAGHVANRITVAGQEAKNAKIALDNMLSIKHQLNYRQLRYAA